MATVEELGGVKEAGDLIRSTDWNAVVEEVVRLDADKADLTVVTALQGQVTTLTGQVATLLTQITSLTTTVTTLQTDVTALRAILGDYFQLRLSTTSQTFAVGSQAEITAQVRDLVSGAPVTFAAGQPRPWIDFVTTWGRLFPAPAFASASRDGGGRRSVSVQVNAAGEARVLLRGETSAGIAADDEDRMMATMQAQTAGGGQRTVERVILDAQTPAEAEQQGAWSMISSEYESTGGGVRRYLENLYVQGRNRPVDIDRNRWGQRFEDHRCTVMAFLKPDGDPISPDQSRGVSSIQITFRDWFWGWVDFGYIRDIEVTERRIREDVFTLIEDVPIVDELGPRVDEVLKRWADGGGLIERERNVGVLINVLDEARAPAGRADVDVVFEAGRQALELQQQLDRGGALAGQSRTGGPMGAIVKGAGRTESRTAGVRVQVEQQASATEELRELVGTVENEVQFMSGQFEETVAEGGRLSIALTGVQNLRAEVAGLSETLAGPTDVRLRDLRNETQSILERVVRLGG